MKIFVLTTISMLVLIGHGASGNENPLVSKNEPTIDRPDRECSNKCVRFDFRWLELSNELYSSKFRHIDVFLDPKAFSEDNLRNLFEHLSKANGEPENLTVSVYTDWAQIDPAAPNCPGTGISNMPEPPDKYDYLQATFWRRGEREYFRYSPKIKVHVSDFTQVNMRQPKNSNN